MKCVGCSFLNADDRKGGRYTNMHWRGPGHISVRQNEGKPWVHLLPLTCTLIGMHEDSKHCSALSETVTFSGLLFLFLLTTSLCSHQILAGKQAFNAVVSASMAFPN